jgi:hypothetical protein
MDFEADPTMEVPAGCPYSYAQALKRYVFMHSVLVLLAMFFALILIYLPVEKPALDARKAYSRAQK